MIREDLAFKAPLPQGMSARLMEKPAFVGEENTLKTRRRRRAREGLKVLPVFFDRSNILGSLDHLQLFAWSSEIYHMDLVRHIMHFLPSLV